MELVPAFIVASLKNIATAALDAKQSADPAVGIYIADLSIELPALVDGQTYRIYGARIEPGKWVRPHSHRVGREPYVMLTDGGEMNTGNPSPDGRAFWGDRDELKFGDLYVVGERRVHCLRNLNGERNLDFLFACPENHLNDADRFFVANLPPHFPKS